MTLAIHGALDEQAGDLDSLQSGIQDTNAKVRGVEERTQQVGKSSRMCGKACQIM